MAGYRGNLTFEDGEGHKSNLTLYMDDGLLTDTEDRVNQMEAFAAAIAPYVNGRVVELSVTVDGTIPAGLTDAADPMSEVEIKATFPYRTAAGKTARFSIPTLNRAVAIRPGSDEVVDAFQNAVNGQIVPGPFVDSNNSDIVELQRGREAFSNRRRR